MKENFKINEIVEIIQDDLRSLAVIVNINNSYLFNFYEVKKFNGIKYYDDGNCAILNYDNESICVPELKIYKVNKGIKELYNYYRY